MTEPAGSAVEDSSDLSSPRGLDATSRPAATSLTEDLPDLDGSAANPEELWGDFFSKRTPKPATVRDLVSRLHESRRHDHVAAVIRAALLHGQSQPWMYEVLALTLQIQGAPQAEVERALLSQIDFAATDATSLMVSAAYLTRFGAERPALRLYRQASELAPERPEPYLLGQKIARRLGDDEGLVWSVRGVFATAWGAGHARQHQDAENAIADRVRELRESGNPQEADAIATSLADAKQVDLHARLEWTGEGALDLAVHEPGGVVCSVESPRTPGGGVLAHDGHGPKPENCYDEYVCAAGFPGVYRIEVRHAWGEIVGKRARLTIVRHRGTTHETVRELIVPVADEPASVRVTLNSGRRSELLSVPANVKASSADSRIPLPRLVGRLDEGVETPAGRLQGPVFQQVGGGGFATGQTPIVGAGAVGIQPQITIVPDGINVTAQAIVSGDRRYVRLTLAPSFTEVIDVLQFTFFSSGN